MPSYLVPAPLTVFSLHILALALLLVTSWRIVTFTVRSSRNLGFWIAALLAMASFIVTSGVELSFASIYFSPTPIGSWQPWHTLIGDISLRIGLASMTLCRLGRYRIVAPHHDRIVMLTMALLVVTLLASMGVTTKLRLATISLYAANGDPAAMAYYVYWAEVERGMSFATMLGIQLINLIADKGFLDLLTKNATLATRDARTVPMSHIYRIFALNFFVTLVYLGVLMWVQLTASRKDPIATGSVLYTLTIQRFVPAIEAMIFFMVIIPSTRTLLPKAVGSSAATPDGERGQEETIAAQDHMSDLLSNASRGGPDKDGDPFSDGVMVDMAALERQRTRTWSAKQLVKMVRTPVVLTLRTIGMPAGSSPSSPTKEAFGTAMRSPVHRSASRASAGVAKTAVGAAAATAAAASGSISSMSAADPPSAEPGRLAAVIGDWSPAVDGGGS
ncbi:hypothetical protein BC828DRAFT_375095 [Blastocladiella britannica]|nr:hypothetical protein BC828DRAFT_375095 [Blastocladiella britannica]